MAKDNDLFYDNEEDLFVDDEDNDSDEYFSIAEVFKVLEGNETNDFDDSDDGIELNDDNTSDCMNDKEYTPNYEIIYNTKLEENETPFSEVIGHENQKSELLNVINWFKNSKELKDKGVSIPKGVILFGDPGNGKSLFIKEMVKCAEAPVFIFKGEKENIVSGIIDIFEKARESGHAIIVIDELDLLINNDRRVIRALQENLDGVESTDDILVLAATNNLSDIPSPLMRNGRLEKLIKIPYPTGNESVELLKRYFNEFKIELPNNFDNDEIALSLNGISCAGIKSVVNDIVLRNGFNNITVEMIDDSIYNITNKVKSSSDNCTLEIAIHEASHAITAMAFPEYFIVNRLNLSDEGGTFHAKEVDKGFWTYKKIIADIKISMAGILAQKIICGSGSRGVEDDLQNARAAAYNMFNQNGYSSCWETLPYIDRGREETQPKRRKMERKIEKLLRKCEKETAEYVRQHRESISKLGQLLLEKKHLKSSEIMACVA